MPFGLANRPAVFQELISIALQGPEDFALAYLDEFLIFLFDTINDHLEHIESVLNNLRKHNLRFKTLSLIFLRVSVLRIKSK